MGREGHKMSLKLTKPILIYKKHDHFIKITTCFHSLMFLFSNGLPDELLSGTSRREKTELLDPKANTEKYWSSIENRQLEPMIYRGIILICRKW